MVGKYPLPPMPEAPKTTPAPHAPRDKVEGSAKAPEEKPQINPLPKSTTLWGGITAVLSGMGGTIAGFFDRLNNPYTLAAFIIIVLVICVGGYFVLTGRLNVQKKLEDMATRDA